MDDRKNKEQYESEAHEEKIADADEHNENDVEEETDSKEKVVEEKGEEVAEVDEVSKEQKRIEELEKENKEQYDRMLRIQAEYDNYKRRTQKERINERKYQAQDLANELLPVLDNFERALQVEITEENKGIFEGIQMVYKQLLEALASQGIEPIEVEGKQFDPNLHHAVMQTEDENYESNEIVEEMQKGYMLKDRVLRPSMVKVNK
ncbi:MAG TPA: nucleotide exchange factor GrpE [Bacillota bacterium]|nr:nucleotide exchange factor GrpE [Bacillota bacterium]